LCGVSFEQVRNGPWLLVDHLMPAVRDDLDGYVAPAVIPQSLRNGGVEWRHRMVAAWQRDGIVARLVTSEPRLRMDYALTDFGATLKPVLDGMASWAKHHHRRFGATILPTP
jgi:hypothetical protein